MVHKLTYLFCILFFASVSVAQTLTSQQEQDVSSISHSIMSPYCPGRLLSDCPSGAASDLKQAIRTDIASGKTKEEVLTGLYAKYGESTLRATPKNEGFGLVGWIIPFTFGLIGLFVLMRWLRNDTHLEDGIESAEPQIDISKELEERIRKEI